jgi:hypothetical protein
LREHRQLFCKPATFIIVIIITIYNSDEDGDYNQCDGANAAKIAEMQKLLGFLKIEGIKEEKPILICRRM